ncbi:MAG: sulfurtransferase TusA family protein [Bacillota bacterium]
MPGDKEKYSQVLDCAGLYCPVPVMRSREEMDRMFPGEILEIIADDPAAEEDIPRWAKRAGHTVVNMWKDGSEIHFLIRKGENKEE